MVSNITNSKKLCKTSLQRSIAKFAYSTGMNHPIRNLDSFEEVNRVLNFYLAANWKIVIKYAKMGNSTYLSFRKKNGKPSIVGIY